MQTVRVQISLSQEYVPMMRDLMALLPTLKHRVAGDRLFVLARQGLAHAHREKERGRRGKAVRDLAATAAPTEPEN